MAVTTEDFLGLLATLIIAVPLSYRLGRIIPGDDIAESFRQELTIWAYADESRHRVRVYTHKLLTCQLCLGFWVTLVVGTLVSVALTDQEWYRHLMVAGAATGLQCLVALNERR